jgi:hypothetical protein
MLIPTDVTHASDVNYSLLYAGYNHLYDDCSRYRSYSIGSPDQMIVVATIVEAIMWPGAAIQHPGTPIHHQIVRRCTSDAGTPPREGYLRRVAQ